MQTQTKTYQEKAEIVLANWYNALKQIKDKNGRVGKMSDFIRARNQAPFEDNVWQYGAYTTAGLNSAPKNPVLLLRKNTELLQLENAKRAVQLHRNDKECPITQDTYNRHLKQAEKEAKAKKSPEKRNILILPERDNFSINSEVHFDILRFLAEDPKQAEKYLGRLSEKDINEIDFYLRNKDYVDRQESPFQDQLLLHWVHSRSSLFGDRDLVSDYGGVFGVFEKTGKASSKKVKRSAQKLLYSPKEALKIYRIVQEVRKGDVKISDLESKLSNVADFLENLSK